jgi:hypothetical protein
VLLPVGRLLDLGAQDLVDEELRSWNGERNGKEGRMMIERRGVEGGDVFSGRPALCVCLSLTPHSPLLYLSRTWGFVPCNWTAAASVWLAMAACDARVCVCGEEKRRAETTAETPVWPTL